MEQISSVLGYAAPFVLVLGVLIFFHELGHYLAARWRGVHVEAFSIGFGPELGGWTDRRGCRWRIAAIPLGGYVKMAGQEDGSAVDPEAGGFASKSVGDRAIIIAAGPIANFLLAIVLFAGLFATVGRPTTEAVVLAVQEGSAAEQAGLRTGDRIVAIDGRSIGRFEELQQIVALRPGERLLVEVEREGSRIALPAVPERRMREDRFGNRQELGVLGIQGGGGRAVQLDPFSALWAGAVETARLSEAVTVALWQFLTGSRDPAELRGPLGIAQLSGQVATISIAAVINFIALMSVNLAVINLAPVPILDGGHLVLLAYEKIRGRPLSIRAQEIGLRVGFVLLVGVAVYATRNDLAAFGLFDWVARLTG